MAMQKCPQVRVNDLPSGSSEVFLTSSFFSRNGTTASLPPPSDVLARGSFNEHHVHFDPVIYDDLGLVVKLGKAPRVTIAEGQCLWALRRVLQRVPVPEIFGWMQQDGITFLYMELIQGVTLEDRWDSMTGSERISVCDQLRVMVSEMHKLGRDPNDLFLGKFATGGVVSPLPFLTCLGDIRRGPYSDVAFTNGVLPRAGPFSAVADFHDWLSATIKRGKEIHWPGYRIEDIPDPYRQMLPDAAAVVFTHADLHPSNMIVSADSDCRVVAIIDWHQAGWYPGYWEFCKAQYAVQGSSEWATKYIPRFLDEPDDIAWNGFEHYTRAFGY